MIIFNHFKLKHLLPLVAIFAMAGCTKENSGTDGPTPVEKYFDFATTDTYTLNLDYKLSYSAPVVFYVYDVNPILTDPADPTREILNPQALPVLKGMTQGKGIFNGQLTLKKTVSDLYIYSTTIGVPQILKATYSNKIFTVDGDNPQSYLAAKVSDNNNLVLSLGAVQNPSMTLGSWSNAGVPSYLLATNATISEGLMNDINASLPEQSKVPIASPHFISQGVNSALQIIENAVVQLVFVHEGAGYRNVLGYFHYPTNNPPTSISQVNRIVAFPNVSYNGSGGGLKTGNRIQLKYWDGTAFQNVFPAGTSIGWFIIADGFKNNGTINHNATHFYSMNQFNPESAADKKPHNVLLYDSERSLVLIGFEDMNREGGSDDDFNDAVFYTTATPETAIKYTNLPVIVKTNDRDKDGVPDSIDEFPDDVNLAYTTHYPSLNTYYTLAFEDLWPNRGDYDMNDVVITYNSTHYLNGMSQVSKIVDRIKPVWAGGQIGSGYGYQLGIPSSGVSSVTKTSTYTDNNFTYTLLPNGTEQGQTNATIMVFDNINDLNVTSPQKPQFNMEIRLTTPQTVDKITTPPYNPFIVINSGDKRSKEVHLPNYKPTDKADKSLLGTYNDKSSVSANRYYVSDDNMPFAIQIPNASFEYPTEATSITVYYPYFLQWAQSFGVQYPDWYTRNR